MSELKAGFSANCQNCGLQKVCFSTGLTKEDIDRLDTIVERKAPLKKNQHLFMVGDKFTALYVIRAGVVKLYSFSDIGEEIIHGFYLPGDMIGIDALQSEVHAFNAIAIDTVSVCHFPYAQLCYLGTQVPDLNHKFFSAMSKEVNECRLHSELLTRRNADQRVAKFIWHMIERYAGRGYASDEFRLGILHRDVALYLGLTPETVSRILAKLHADHIVTWKKKELIIHNKTVLQGLAGFAICS
ncbi:helix-turn-helix domain-containing protein [Thiomicrorhabdus arctica]|uniref:helix-turn-helix domain-containing protein n=1 Tax=Thiomicrorhabdus arctica TaxID=131540 RepID=UPI00037B1064|nr:helix-turn-helix domain-containing protein [Thiomicrorhabdus arctica]